MSGAAARGARRVAIVGAGIGGLTAALALADGDREVTLIERRTGFGEDGAGIQVSPNASRILIGLGLGAALRRAGSAPERVAIRALASGRALGGVTLGGRMEERLGAPYLVIARTDLHTLLLDAVRSRPNIRLRVGRSPTAATPLPDGIALDLESAAGATERLEADLVVGADGIGSRMRALAGDGRIARPTGAIAYRALVPAGAVAAAGPAGETGLWLGRGRHVVHYAIQGGRVLNVVAVADERGRRTAEGWSAPTAADHVLGLFRDAAAPLRAVLEAAPAWSAWSISRLPVGRMGRGRIVLLGDAAHPVPPYLAQGGALAIEDADALARALMAAPDAAAAVAAYARARTPRARTVQDRARGNGRIYHLGGAVALARDVAMRRLDDDRMADRYDWLYGFGASCS